MCAGATTVFIKMFEWLKSRDKEKSVGAIKVAEFLEHFIRLDGDIKKLTISDENQSAQIKVLQTHHEETMRTLIDFLKR
jgi:hypothetical protein